MTVLSKPWYRVPDEGAVQYTDHDAVVVVAPSDADFTAPSDNEPQTVSQSNDDVTVPETIVGSVDDEGGAHHHVVVAGSSTAGPGSDDDGAVPPSNSKKTSSPGNEDAPALEEQHDPVSTSDKVHQINESGNRKVPDDSAIDSETGDNAPKVKAPSVFMNFFGVILRIFQICIHCFTWLVANLSLCLASMGVGLLKVLDWLVIVLIKLLSIACVVGLAAFALKYYAPLLSSFNNEDAASAASPIKDLQNFVRSQDSLSNTSLSSFQDLKTETFEDYAATYCLEGPTFEATRSALSDGLVGVPQSVRDDIVRVAVREGITAKNTWKNSNADLVNSNRAHSYMAYYSTLHDTTTGKYQTCVTVTGVTFTVAETIAGYTEIEEEYYVGEKHDCTGAFFTCHKVPYYGKRIRREPQFKRSVLSLHQQELLNTWMIRHAIESANHLVSSSSSESDKMSKEELTSGDEKGWEWKPPQYVDEL